MAQCTLPVTRAPYDGAALEVTVRGLAGGHSGTEIHKGRANVLRDRMVTDKFRDSLLHPEDRRKQV